MNDEQQVRLATRRNDTAPLVERLDHSLGEASTGIGVMLSELVRRTLRGGVQKIDEELQEFVEEKLDGAVADRMPQFRQHAAETATATAERVIRDAVEAVAQHADQSDRELREKLNELRQQAEDAGKSLQEAVGAVERKAEDSGKTLHEAVTAVERKADESTKQLSEQLHVVRERADSALTAAEREAARLASLIQVAQQSAEESTNRKLEDIQSRSRGVVVQIETALRKHAESLGQLTSELNSERTARGESLQEVRRAVLSQLGSQLEARDARIAALERELADMKKKPQGFWSKMFGRKEKPAAPEGLPEGKVEG